MPFQKLSDKCPLIFDINFMKEMLIAPDEVFVPLEEINVPGIVDNYYMVSNYGRVYNRMLNQILTPQIGTDGYFSINIRMKNNPKGRNMRINRLVMMGFYPTPEADNLVVNHLDCNPQNNHISNLEWTTRTGNAIHAYDNGLMGCGEDSPTSIITEETAVAIGKYLRDTNLTYKEIAELVGGNATWAIVQNISQGRDWVRTMKKYGIDCCRNNASRTKRFRLSKDDVHHICQLFEKYPNTFSSDADYYYFIAEQLNCFGTGLPPSEFRNTIGPIYNKKNHKDIVSQYKF